MNSLINCDLSQAELRVMALLSNDPWMINALQAGQGDFFTNHLMPVCYPVLEEEKAFEIVAFDDKGAGITRFESVDPTGFKEARTNVKGIQYGLAFGREAPAIAAALGITRREAELILNNYLQTASGFAQWRVDVMEAAVRLDKRDLLINPFGRKFQSEIITGKNFRNIQREALSFLPQSTSSDICLATAIRIHDSLEDQGYNIFNIVHDAIMVEGPEENCEVVGQFIAEQLQLTGEMVFGNTVPFLAEYSVGKSWSELS